MTLLLRLLAEEDKAAEFSTPLRAAVPVRDRSTRFDVVPGNPFAYWMSEVLFGHTHKPLLWQRFGWPSRIYANTGTWIDSKPMTWVEVDIRYLRFSRRSYTVSLWYEGQGTPRQSGTIIV